MSRLWGLSLVFSFFYVGIPRDLYRRLAIISGEVRRSIIVGIGAVLLDRLHAELRCLGTLCDSGGDEESGKGTGGDDSSPVRILVSINHGEPRCPTAAMRSHSHQQSIQQSTSILCDGYIIKTRTYYDYYYFYGLFCHDESTNRRTR
jgi:hypothetical protein